MGLFSFKGRASRRDFWTVAIALTLLQMLATILVGTFLSAALNPIVEPEQQPLVATVFAATITLAFSWPIAAVGVRRSHDRNMSGRWFLIYMAISVAVGTWNVSANARGIAEASSELPALAAAGLLQLVLLVVFVIILGFLKGTPGPNRYGSPPGTASSYYSQLGKDGPGGL
jgi:uncharacterized membrane protein YhaH (DUF805 family)